MSIYSGFATRAAETRYDQLTLRLISVLMAKLAELGCFADRPFRSTVERCLLFMQSMEESKYLDPKIGNTFLPKLETLNFSI
jgi:hypothetical protein